MSEAEIMETIHKTVRKLQRKTSIERVVEYIKQVKRPAWEKLVDLPQMVKNVLTQNNLHEY